MTGKELIDWAVLFLKQRDLFKKEIINIDVDYDNNELIINKNTGLERVVVTTSLSDIKNIINKSPSIIITLNNKDNLRLLISNWRLLVKFESLKLFFVNPKNNESWALIPFLHDKVADKKTLKQGLTSMSESIGEAF